jgi:hypothetical protein
MVRNHLLPTQQENTTLYDLWWARIHELLLLLLTINFLFLTLQSCGLDVEDPTPPSPPVWVQKSLPEEWPEQGIDAHETGGIFMEWQSNHNQGIIAYLIYRAKYFEESDSLGEYVVLSRIETDLYTGLSYIDSDLLLGTKYFYKLKAEDNSENRSDFSESLGFSLLPQIPIGTMTPNGLLDTLDGEVKLIWRYDNNVEMEDYCLTLTNLNADCVFREVFNPGNYLDGTEQRIIPTSVVFEPGQIYLWRIDTGAKYVDGLETAASESPWATFLYQ